jgi:hypothetical protein
VSKHFIAALSGCDVHHFPPQQIEVNRRYLRARLVEAPY